MSEFSARDEEAINEDAITSLAEEMDYPLRTIRQVYEAEFSRLKAEASITDYLVLLAVRRTRDALLATRSESTMPRTVSEP